MMFSGGAGNRSTNGLNVTVVNPDEERPQWHNGAMLEAAQLSEHDLVLKWPSAFDDVCIHRKRPTKIIWRPTKSIHPKY